MLTKWIMFLTAILVLSGCGAEESHDGAQGIPGENCTVAQTTIGAVITCPDGSQAVVLHGQDGTDKMGKTAKRKNTVPAVATNYIKLGDRLEVIANSGIRIDCVVKYVNHGDGWLFPVTHTQVNPSFLAVAKICENGTVTML